MIKPLLSIQPTKKEVVLMSVFLTVFYSGLIVMLFLLVAYIVIMSLYAAAKSMFHMRPDCYGTHGCSAHASILNNCNGCAYEKECWEKCHNEDITV